MVSWGEWLTEEGGMRAWMRLIALVLLLLAAPAMAEDVLVLSSGRELRGRVVEETQSKVRFETGSGSIWYPRDRIREVRKGVDPVVKAAPTVREEHAVLYAGERRVGARTLRVVDRDDGIQFEEHVVFLDDSGRPELDVRTIERCDADFRPVFFQVQERHGLEPGGDEQGGGEQGADEQARLVRGDVAGTTLLLKISRDGKTTRESGPMPLRARFSFAARELFLREHSAVDGQFGAEVFDVRDRRWRSVIYRDGGSRAVEEDGQVARVRIVRRRRGDIDEIEWVDAELRTRLADLNGAELRAHAAAADVVAAIARGEGDGVTGPDSAAKTRFADPEHGFAIGKPDPSWTFEEPPVRGASALLSVRNPPLSASVDVLRDEAPPEDLSIQRAAESLQRLLRAHATEVRVLRDGYEGEGAERWYWLEATATTKGERTHTIARVHVKSRRIYRLLAACPAEHIDAVRPDLEAILDSFEQL